MNPVRVAYSDGPHGPRIPPAEALAAAGFDPAAVPDVLLGWTVERHPWIEDPGFRARAVMAGYALARPVNEGRVTALPIRLSAVGRMLEADPPDLAVVAGIRRGDGFALGGSVGWAPVLARVAGRVVVEVDEGAPDIGSPAIEGNVVASVPRPPAAGEPPAASRPADEIDLRIGATVAALVPDGATLQFGPGGIGEGIARAIDRPVAIWSGLVTDAMAELHARGLLAEPALATYCWGGEPVERLAAAGMLRLAPVTVTHDLTRMSATPRFVGCNTALQVGLDGSVGIERVGGRAIAPIGGHSDFCLGASRSVGGLSIIALRSTTARGESTIVPRVELVSTQRSDVDVVVTEHGVADLRGIGDDERARRIAAIAAPDHRTALAAG